jgi:hypothetical protein
MGLRKNIPPPNTYIPFFKKLLQAACNVKPKEFPPLFIFYKKQAALSCQTLKQM